MLRPGEDVVDLSDFGAMYSSDLISGLEDHLVDVALCELEFWVVSLIGSSVGGGCLGMVMSMD